MDIAIGNFILNIYFGSFDIADGDEHFYYKLTFYTEDKIPIATAKLNYWSYENLIDNLEYLPEACGFGFDFTPSEPFVNYMLWAAYESGSENYYNESNISTAVDKDAKVHLALYKTKYGRNELPLIDIFISADDYFNAVDKMKVL